MGNQCVRSKNTENSREVDPRANLEPSSAPERLHHPHNQHN